jgi:hypothetical protein
MAHIRLSRPVSCHDFLIEFPQPFTLVPLRSEAALTGVPHIRASPPRSGERRPSWPRSGGGGGGGERWLGEGSESQERGGHRSPRRGSGGSGRGVMHNGDCTYCKQFISSCSIKEHLRVCPSYHGVDAERPSGGRHGGDDCSRCNQRVSGNMREHAKVCPEQGGRRGGGEADRRSHSPPAAQVMQKASVYQNLLLFLHYSRA